MLSEKLLNEVALLGPISACSVAERPKSLCCLLPLSCLLKIYVDLGWWQIRHVAARAMKRTQQGFKPAGCLLFEEGLTARRTHAGRDAANNHLDSTAPAGKILTHAGRLWPSTAVSCTVFPQDFHRFFFRRGFLRRFQSGSQWVLSGT